MQYTDRVYGDVEITEPVILELIQSPTLQRLKEIELSWADTLKQESQPKEYFLKFDM